MITIMITGMGPTRGARAYGEGVSVTIGLVGAGRRAAEVHAPALSGSADVRFAGIWSRRPESARELAHRHHVASYDRFADLLDHCEAVAFAIPPDVQTDLAAAAARARRAVLLEKPLANDLAGAEEIAVAVTSAGVVSQVALDWRYAEPVRQFLAMAAPRTRPLGGSGRVVTASPHDRQRTQPWRFERGVLLGEGPDLIDLLDAALGRIVGVRAHGDPLGWVGLLLEHAGGRFSEASLCATAGTPPRAEVEVFGPGGAAFVNCAAAAGPDSFATMVTEFAAAVAAGKPRGLDVQRGLHLQEVLDNAETDLFTHA
ncbi:Gfo/Idh/MocA family oxidoreductase [Actinopolymorpha sp. B9G3]|uniref:Gfo/Idh/MocA family protein n=1 Tax=Actinopolymorpha sp. B9G3 TaxID=3158970 RepID=UPI0032D96B0C